MSALIRQVLAREILDSRGNPTVEVEVILTDGVRTAAAVPSGASTGTHEAIELRDPESPRYRGKGVRTAVAHVIQTLAPLLRGKSVEDQRTIDRLLLETDGTPNKGRLGANALLGVSLACARARAMSQKKPLYRALADSGPVLLPVPLLNVINGGAHASNNLDIQEFMLAPMGLPTFAEALRASVEIYQVLASLIRTRGASTAVGDEGGFAPDLAGDSEAMDLLMTAAERAGYQPGRDLRISLDVAASECHEEGRYRLFGGLLDAEELIERYVRWVDTYPIFSIEDPLAEDDWPHWQELTRRIGNRVRIVGDDLYVTHPARLERGIQERSSNAILVKVNQIGTLTETLDTMNRARKAGWINIVSHRSGETEDTFIADLSVGTACGWIKTGAPCRGERTAKYNRLLRIEEELGSEARYAGKGL
jgi:enolase